MARSIVLSAWLASQVVAQLPELPQITPAPILNHAALAFNAAVTDAGYLACQSAADAVDQCSSALGVFSEQSNSKIAQCLCCAGSVWFPDDFDGNAQTCATYIKTELPGSTAEYSAYSVLGDFCTSEGNVCGGKTATVTRTASAATAAVSPGCYSLLDIVSSCEADRPGITTAALRSQADCYCYTTGAAQRTAWVPDVFDDYGSECARWASTADPTNYSSWKEVATFCNSVGNFLTSTSASTRTSSSSRRSTVTSTSSSSTTPAAFETGTGPQTTSSTATTGPGITATGSSPTRPNAAVGGVAYGQQSAAVGMAGIVVALFSYFL